METHEVKVDGKHAATITVRSPVEMCTHAADIRKVWESAIGPVEVTSTIIRSYSNAR